MTIAEFQAQMKRLNDTAQHGCGNHGCKINPPKGQGTNGGCSCTPYNFSESLLWLAAELVPDGKYTRWTVEAPFESSCQWCKTPIPLVGSAYCETCRAEFEKEEV
jgi:hypothetical protein